MQLEWMVISIIIVNAKTLPNFHVSLFFSSLQKDSQLPAQTGDYLKDSFRVETLAPFANAVVDGFSEHERRINDLEYTNLLFRIMFSSGMID